jgi:hypothetical protein
VQQLRPKWLGFYEAAKIFDSEFKLEHATKYATGGQKQQTGRSAAACSSYLSRLLSINVKATGGERGIRTTGTAFDRTTV